MTNPSTPTQQERCPTCEKRWFWRSEDHGRYACRDPFHSELPSPSPSEPIHGAGQEGEALQRYWLDRNAAQIKRIEALTSERDEAIKRAEEAEAARNIQLDECTTHVMEASARIESAEASLATLRGEVERALAVPDNYYTKHERDDITYVTPRGAGQVLFDTRAILRSLIRTLSSEKGEEVKPS